MFGTFLLPFRHLSLDYPWIDSVTPRLRALRLHFPEQAFVPRPEFCGRLGLAFGQPTLQDLETSGERQAVRVQVDRRGRLEHQRPDHEMGQRYGIDLLDHSLWRLAPQLRRLGSPA